MDYHDGGNPSRLVPLFAGLIVVLAWFGLWWGAQAAHPVLQDAPREAAVGNLGGAALPVLGVVGLALALLQVIRRQRRMVAELKAKDCELKDCRDRLRRYVADLERVSDIAAHDLQEPLRRMVAYAQLLERHDHGGLDDEAKLYMSYVVDGARRMKALVNALRTFVSVDNLPLVQETGSATAAVAVARQRLGDSLDAANAALVVEPLPSVTVDQGALVEIFAQLIDNAVRFHSAGRRPVVHVSAKRDGKMTTFFIRDNGIGIEASRVARMFEIFYRPHGTEMASGTSIGGGVGMGLAVVRRLVERLGGVVSVESQVGKGSTFSFSLPTGPVDGEARSSLGQEATAA